MSFIKFSLTILALGLDGFTLGFISGLIKIKFKFSELLIISLTSYFITIGSLYINIPLNTINLLSCFFTISMLIPLLLYIKYRKLILPYLIFFAIIVSGDNFLTLNIISSHIKPFLMAAIITFSQSVLIYIGNRLICDNKEPYKPNLILTFILILTLSVIKMI